MSISNVKKKIIVNNKIIVLNQVDERIVPPEKGIKNLVALDSASNILWEAELPRDYPYGYYDNFDYINNNIIAYCGSTRCEININTGEIEKCELIK